jgi:hypothetical protein
MTVLDKLSQAKEQLDIPYGTVRVPFPYIALIIAGCGYGLGWTGAAVTGGVYAVARIAAARASSSSSPSSSSSSGGAQLGSTVGSAGRSGGYSRLPPGVSGVRGVSDLPRAPPSS